MKKLLTCNPITYFSAISLILLLCFVFPSHIVTFAETSEKPLYGISYSPLRHNQSPDSSLHPSISDIENDIQYLSSLTDRLRIYDISGNNQFIPLIAEKYDIKLTVGLYMSSDTARNLEHISTITKLANRYDNTIETIVVGNDIFANNIMDETELVRYVKLVKNNAESNSVKVTVAGSWDLWNQYPSLINEVDLLTIHVYPYYDGIDVNVSALYVSELYTKFQDALVQSHKDVIVGETGWPSAGSKWGQAVASPENQRKFVDDFKSLSESSDIKYFLFEAFDESWKPPFSGSVSEQNFGLFYENGTLKESLIGVIPEPVHKTTRNTENISPDLDDAVWLSAYLKETHFSTLSWMSDLVSLWNDNLITNKEFLNAVHYLIRHDIVKI